MKGLNKKDVNNYSLNISKLKKIYNYCRKIKIDIGVTPFSINEAKLIETNVFNQLLKLIPEIKKYILHLKPGTFNKYILFLSGKDDYLFFEDVRKFSSKMPTPKRPKKIPNQCQNS